MTDADREIRVLHIVSDGAIDAGLQPTLFMPLLTRVARARVQSQVVSLAPSAVPAAMLRQHGIPVHDISLTATGWSPRAAAEVRQVARDFLPDIIQAWGRDAQLVSLSLRKRCDPQPRLVWSVTDTDPLPPQAGWLTRRAQAQAVRGSATVERVVYASSAGAARHLRAGFTGEQHEIIPPGVDAVRFKPDAQARARLREQWQVPAQALVVGMHAPLHPGSGHEFLVRAASELVKSHPQAVLVLAGHGVHPGNAALMAMIGNGALASRCQLLGEWSDLAGFYNACDLVCSSALDDSGRMHLAMAMLCGVPCVASGPGAQGEVVARHGVVVEPGSATALLKGMQRLLQLDAAQRARLIQGARQHAMTHHVFVRSLQKYLQLYCDLLGIAPLPQPVARQGAAQPAATLMNGQQTAPVAPGGEQRDAIASVATGQGGVRTGDAAVPSIQVDEPQPQQSAGRQDQEGQRRSGEQAAASAAAASNDGDVLKLFEQQMKRPVQGERVAAERARGVADESEILLPPEVLGMTVEMEVTEEALLAAGWHSQDAARVGAPARTASTAASGNSAGRPAAEDTKEKTAGSGKAHPAGADEGTAPSQMQSAAVDDAGNARSADDFELSLVATGAQPLLSQPMLDAVSDAQALALLERAARTLDETPLTLVDDGPPRRSGHAE